jgi:hypothetical protein
MNKMDRMERIGDRELMVDNWLLIVCAVNFEVIISVYLEGRARPSTVNFPFSIPHPFHPAHPAHPANSLPDF